MAKLDFNECVKSGVEQAMKECELTIGMTLKECVEKQIPKKPKKKEIQEEIYNAGGFTRTVKVNICPICKKMLGCENYCFNCGQRLDWSEEE